jgi:hypothetical protein
MEYGWIWNVQRYSQGIVESISDMSILIHILSTPE